MSGGDQAAVVAEVRASLHPHDAVGEIAKRHGLDRNQVWAWTHDAALASAQARLGGPGLLERLMDEATRADVLAASSADRTLAFANCLHDRLRHDPATPEVIRAFVRALPADGSHDAELGSIVFHANFPEDLLFALLDEGRFIDALGHRAGPERLLVRLADEHDDEEAITTLATAYYGRDDYPIDAFLAFVKKHHESLVMSGNLERNAKISDERRRLAMELLDE
jgi:hypothetical protein